MAVTVILVNYNDRRQLGACLGALRMELRGGDEIILVDNASTDGSPEFVAAEFPEVRVILNQHNAGFGAANNQGVRAASSDAVMFLNTDTVVQSGSIRRLLETLDGEPAVAAVGPALIRPDGSFQVSFGKTVSFLGQFIQKAVLNPYHKRVLPRRTGPRTAGWLSAACLLARTDAVRRVGGYDERFFIYFEDIDLCRRLARAGGRLIYEPRACVFHEGGGSTSARARVSRFEYRRSQLYNYDKHASRLSGAFLRIYLRAAVALLDARGVFGDEEGRALRARYRSLFRKGNAAA